MVSSIRLSGLVSGMDTDNVVKELMKAQRAPLNKLLQRKQTDSWKRDSLREMNALLLDFRMNTVSNMRLQGPYLKKKLVADNENAVSIKQTGSPNLSTYNVKVNKLAQEAEPARLDTKTLVTDPSKTLKEAGFTGTFNFTIKNGTQITLGENDTMDSVVKLINDQSSQTGVVATFFDEKLIFTSTSTGTAAEINLEYDNVPNAKIFGLSQDTSASPPTTLTVSKQGEAGVAGEVVINGVTSSITSNKFTYDGIELYLKQEGVSFNVNSSQDEDAIFDSIKGFVDKYNELIDKLNQKISEVRYKNYQPLLDEEKEALSEKQIEQLEGKAKSGILRNDPYLQKALTQMRQIMSAPVAGISDAKFDTLNEIGIGTAKADGKFAVANYQENGKLYIDEKKLREAIRDNGTKVLDLFTKNPSETTTDADEINMETGIAKRLYNNLQDIISRITDVAGLTGMGETADGFSMGRQMKTLNKSIDSLELRLKSIEDRYYKQFAAMEQAMSKANSQSSWLAQQFGGGQ